MYAADEGSPFEPAGYRNDTLYISSIRDPIGRVVSNYEYEGRWNCGEQRRLMKQMKKAYAPLLEHANPFESFMKRNDKKTRSCKGSLWECHENCHVRWFALPHRLNCGSTNYTIIEDSAYHSAGSHHLIVRTEFLRNPTYVAELERYFGVAGVFSKPIKAPTCDPIMKRANTLLPATYPDDLREELRKANVADYRLFDKLNADCPEGIIFPERTLLDVINPPPAGDY
jgi:hypothetical protein